MVHVCKEKRKCRILGTTAINLLSFGLLVSSVLVATVNVIRVDAVECGTVNLYREAIIGGKEVIKDEWPFIAALFYSETDRFFCGGTIISHKHVLTAAHCIHMKGKGDPLSPDKITVRLGAYNLTDRSEEDTVDRKVAQIYIHPDWKVNDEKYDADIAILVLNKTITFSNHIRPVCMPPANFLIDGLTGTVVGWGKTENGTAEGIPRKIEVNALNDTYCYEKDKGIASYASERSFCAEGSGTPNEGDSGGGFFAVAGSGWVQFGTVSFVRPKATGNSLSVALYMKLPSLKDWIAEKVGLSGDNISLATTKADLDCSYKYAVGTAYSCWLFDLNIRQENFVVEQFTGRHHNDKNNDDVEMITFNSGVMFSLPRNFGILFKNLKHLFLFADTRRIFRSNFQNVEHLEEITFANCRIGQFDENSLWDLPNLRSFQLEHSELKLLHAATFSRNYMLKTVKVVSTALNSLPRNLFENNLLLESAVFDDCSIRTIDENIFETNANLRVVNLMGNYLTHLSANLLRNNSELRVLTLGNNHIKTIDEQSFQGSFKLLLLALNSNELQFLPARLFHGMESLETLYLNKNALRAIDEQMFETNVRIKKISLESNQLTHIPANLFRNNSQLQLIHIGSNSIHEIDENLFEKNPILRIVFLDFNFLVELPRNLFRHHSMLELVNARWNSLETIDERIFEWNTRLREIIFDNNQVTSLPGKLFQNNSLLEIVRFNANSLETMDEHTFETNANLQEVYLQSNMMTHVPEQLFRNNPLLNVIDLSVNFFTTLKENTFSYNANLEEIYLHSGIMQSLPRNLFQSNYRLRKVDLSFNFLVLIKTNFTTLKHADYINLSENVCTDTTFHVVESDSYTFTNKTRRTSRLAEFQDLVMADCA